jgi:hypothetical protein
MAKDELSTADFREIVTNWIEEHGILRSCMIKPTRGLEHEQHLLTSDNWQTSLTVKLSPVRCARADMGAKLAESLRPYVTQARTGKVVYLYISRTAVLGFGEHPLNLDGEMTIWAAVVLATRDGLFQVNPFLPPDLPPEQGFQLCEETNPCIQRGHKLNITGTKCLTCESIALAGSLID